MSRSGPPSLKTACEARSSGHRGWGSKAGRARSQGIIRLGRPLPRVSCWVLDALWHSLSKCPEPFPGQQPPTGCGCLAGWLQSLPHPLWALSRLSRPKAEECWTTGVTPPSVPILANSGPASSLHTRFSQRKLVSPTLRKSVLSLGLNLLWSLAKTMMGEGLGGGWMVVAANWFHLSLAQSSQPRALSPVPGGPLERGCLQIIRGQIWKGGGEKHPGARQDPYLLGRNVRGSTLVREA